MFESLTGRESLDLVRCEFRRGGPNRLQATDITEHPTREGKVYCCVVLNAFSRLVVADRGVRFTSWAFYIELFHNTRRATAPRDADRKPEYERFTPSPHRRLIPVQSASEPGFAGLLTS